MLTQGPLSRVGYRVPTDRHPAARQATADPHAASLAIRAGSASGPERTLRNRGRTAGPRGARRHTRMTGRMLGLGLSPSGMAGACTAGCLHSLVGEILAAAMVIVPLTTGVILVAVIVLGSVESSNRVFRLLRCINDEEEPPSPSP